MNMLQCIKVALTMLTFPHCPIKVKVTAEPTVVRLLFVNVTYSNTKLFGSLSCVCLCFNCNTKGIIFI